MSPLWTRPSISTNTNLAGDIKGVIAHVREVEESYLRLTYAACSIFPELERHNNSNNGNTKEQGMLLWQASLIAQSRGLNN